MIAMHRHYHIDSRLVKPNIEHTDLQNKVRIHPGETRAVSGPEQILVTVLGSCVSACIRNPLTGFGGMNHFMLPESDTGEWNGVSAAMRYGNYAMEALINMVLKSGCLRKDLEVKIFGGANLGFHSVGVGTKNIEFVQSYLLAEGIEVGASDLGGNHGRRIYYRPSSGVVRQLYIRNGHEKRVVADEKSYAEALKVKDITGSAELF